MDAKQFDAFARLLAGQPSRRALAGGLASGALGGVLHLLPQPVVEARKKRRKKDNGRAEAEKKKKKKKKVTLCHNGQTITVAKKAKKKHLKHGDTVGPCPETPACTPNANACAGRECGSVDNGCGVQVSCGPNTGACPGDDTCNTNTGQCGCTPDQNPCGNRECGSVDNGCGTPVQCGTCTAPETCNAAGQCSCDPDPAVCAGRQCGTADDACGNTFDCGPNGGGCPGTDTCNATTGQCECTPNPTACDGRVCGSVNNGCGQQVTCGPNNGVCTAPETCNAAGQCICIPDSTVCDGRVCGTVNDGCGPVACGPLGGACPGTDTCNTTSGQCVCNPDPNACNGRACGTVDNGCEQITCGPNNGVCSGTDTCTAAGQCVCTPNPNACNGRVCGTVNNGCGPVTCGPNNGACPGTDICNAAGQCLPAACQNCNGCCTDEGTCLAGNDRQACGYGGGRCEACNPEVACVNGECTCSNGVSCGQGCCTTDAQGQPFCDNTKRPCGNACIPKGECCTGTDSSSYQSIQPGCLSNETCAVNSSDFGECRCGTGGRCQRNQGCCRQGPNGPTCDTTLRPCGGTCISREQCCSEGQVTAVGAECDDGISCTSVTCQTYTGTGTALGICFYNETPGACAEACEAGYGYGNQFPEFQREVRCGSVSGQPCYCWRTTEGDNACTYEFPGAPPCRLSSDCGNGEVCMRSGLVTGTNRCARICQ